MSNLRGLNPLIDCDVIVYSCGFAVKEDEPVENALHLVKQKLDSIRELFPDRSYETLYLSGKDNFRESVATLLPYKGNRDPNHKPVYYKEIKEYLVDAHRAFVVDGKEADDALSSDQWAQKDKSTVICTIDKDLDMIPGYHYNWNKNKLYYIKMLDANKWFWQQMLMGDRVDNIPGIKGLGPVKSERIITACGDDLKNIRFEVENLYSEQYGSDWKIAFNEVATLLFMERAPDKTFEDYI